MSSSVNKHVLVPIGEGTEEMEAIIVIDVIRRAGAQVIVASVENSLQVKCSRGVNIIADSLIADVESQQFDLIACPGGMPGAERLRDCETLERMTIKQRDEGRLYAAICATPAVFFQAKGLMDGHRGTSHPAFSDKLVDQSLVQERVVVDGNLTTSRGPGTAFEFALSLVKQLYGAEKAQQVAGPMVMYPYEL
ncbi:hypothetical protein CEUSTIGMA_g6180.t1 [Chlamydomonas eustigma]|uniref:DJ-1/PfpI domain-containing protein n=1 Tax=Chlamydomonas eustigma TaxID=1157962 RepID=A0A250X6M8_9CHLO|nr:hypothetical protein CEUSTIGMA_g6180.t1 [Chlamydomonas eustigma]|eukprot:GAX78743.1 hypothetical protein CEUSTIGMA_g6180.t1 [Chlamydomonas eustigma]